MLLFRVLYGYCNNFTGHGGVVSFAGSLALGIGIEMDKKRNKDTKKHDNNREKNWPVSHPKSTNGIKYPSN